MNILYVSDSTTVSGAEIVLLNYVDSFRPPRHRAHVFLRSTNARLAKALESRNIEHTQTESFSRLVMQTTANPLALARFWSALSRTSRELIKLVKAHEIDLIHSISYPASLYCALPARLSRIPQVWHEHNIKRIHLINRAIYRWVASSCPAVVGPSDAVTRNLGSAGIPSGKLRTIYNGIDLRRFTQSTVDTDAVLRELAVPPGARAVGLFGQMLPYKGHLTLIRAAPEVLEQHPDTVFLLVGARENGPYEAELEREIGHLGVKAAFRFTGWRDDVQRLIQATDVVIVATTTPEPAALALMETMAMARPIVATRTGGTPEIVIDEETGLLFPPGDGSALARCIIRLLDDPTFARLLGQAGRMRVEREYSLEQHTLAMERLYEEATGRAGS